MILVSLGFLKIILISLLLTFTIRAEVFVSFLNPISAFLFAFAIKKRGGNPLEYLSFFLIDTLIPVFGFFSMLLYYLSGPIYKKIYRNHRIDVFDLPMGEEVFIEHVQDKKLLRQDVKEGRIENIVKNNVEIEPYVDILSGKDLKLKINVIEKLTRMGTPASVQILKKALIDQTYEVRYFANNALEKIEKRMLAAIDTATETISKHSDDYRNYNFRGTLYLDFYTLGILDKETGRSFLEKSMYDFLFSLQLNSNQSYLFVKITHIHLLVRNFEQVISVATQALNSKLNSDDRGKVHFYRAEAMFHLGQFLNVVDECKLVGNEEVQYKLIKDSSDFWSNYGASSSVN
ncbi:MAG: hypothetical protein COW00_15640 [Bdellovibrio sp. CG12_big_fil_rev_8_21_14_0_65_39_13]|nr:MAG: hypothetical protein COW78_05505 [Bdellovibrio sp. CG22_combo_CG10-13_8_21_14_all_39_27]PIQ58432.1 MAG: hypothetical protein COW00_15640 [Bdellovibrio sp. CG12_big_fil_rev_8_21_14_0_65_39_13]PIR35385.1 MAG: hypothetical protein COV37_07855 [Bdellovibrio sp. CG11_big_fil_rev_8_21_14_0_20_39_38]